jgi:fucose permease
MLGLGLEATGLLLIGALVTDTSGYRILLGPLFIAGAGIATAFPTVTTAVMRSVGPDETAVASGSSNTFRQVGAVFGVAIATAIFAADGSYRTASEFVNGLRPAFITLGVLCAIGMLAGVLLRRAPCRQFQNSAHGDSPFTSTRSVTRPSASEPDRQSARPSTSN